MVPAGVIEETPPAGLAVVAEITSPVVGTRALPPVAVEVITCVPVVAAVVPPCTFHVVVTVWVWLITEEKGVPVNTCAGTVPAEPLKVGGLAGHAIGPGTYPPLALVPAGVPPLTELVVAEEPVNAWAAAVREFTVSAGTVVDAPVNGCAAAVREFTVSAGTVVELPVNACAAAVREFTLSAGTVVVAPV